MKTGRSDPVRHKNFRSDPAKKLSDSDGNSNKTRPNPIAFHRILSDSDDIWTGIQPSDRMSWDDRKIH